jgi:hypothetical protein
MLPLLFLLRVTLSIFFAFGAPSFVMVCCSYVMDSPALSNQRGINMGRVYTQVTSWWGWGIGCGVEDLV